MSETDTDVVSPRSGAPLIIEPHPQGYRGYPFITLIQYRKELILGVIDNIDQQEIRAFVLDLCGPAGIQEESVLKVIDEWYTTQRTRYPLSIEFSKRHMTGQTSQIYRTYNTEYVTRIIGPVFKFPMTDVKSVKRRRKKQVPLTLVQGGLVN